MMAMVPAVLRTARHHGSAGFRGVARRHLRHVGRERGAGREQRQLRDRRLFMINGTDNPFTSPTTGTAGWRQERTSTTSQHDGTAFVLMRPFTDRYSEQFLGVQVAHESGHLFGLRHTFGNDPASSPNVDEGLHQSDMMSYLAYTTFGGFRFLHALSDGARQRQHRQRRACSLQCVDVLRPDARRPEHRAEQHGIRHRYRAERHRHITKTGATTGTVTIQAFTDAAYTSAIEVPGSAVSRQRVHLHDRPDQVAPDRCRRARRPHRSRCRSRHDDHAARHARQRRRGRHGQGRSQRNVCARDQHGERGSTASRTSAAAS